MHVKSASFNIRTVRCIITVGRRSKMRLQLKFRNRIDAWAVRFVLVVAALIGFEWFFHIAPADELLIQVVIAIVLGAAGLYRYAKGLRGE